MTRARFLFTTALLVWLIPGAVPARAADGRGGLEACIALYENGEYARAVDSLRALLPRVSDKEVLSEAYKYLAFSYVMLDMINTAKANFDSLLLKFPDAEIDTITVPPNITVVFKQAKLENELKRQQELEEALRREVGRESPAYWIAGASLAGAAGIAGLVFTLRGFDYHRKYDAVGDTSRLEDLRSFRNSSESSFLLSYIAYGAAGASALFGGYKFYRWRSHQEPPAASLHFDGRVARVVWRF